MEKKYIIELPENTHWIQWIMEGTKDHHPYMDYKQVEDLTPYTEPDLDAVRKESYDKGIHDGKNQDVNDFADMYDSGYNEGLKDAWEAARTLWNTPNRKENFGYTTFNSAITTLTAQEALEEIRQHEKAQEEQEKEASVTVEDVMRQYLDTFCKRQICSTCPLNISDFTCGRGYHFLSSQRVSGEEVRRAYAEVLRKMREG